MQETQLNREVLDGHRDKIRCTKKNAKTTTTTKKKSTVVEIATKVYL